jgi:hypothetical protein
MRDWLPILRAPRSPASVTVVGVMDRDGWTERTDNLVVVDAHRRALTWIPRDLWSDAVGDRINEAYGRGGPPLLLEAVRALGWPASSSVVLLRSAAERVLRDLSIAVPVDRVRRYWYPLSPLLRLQDGRKLVEFRPPAETLSGERIHQWIGARTSADEPRPALPDLDRIARQHVFVRRLLETGFGFDRVLDDPAQVAIAGDDALAVLRAVRADWTMRTFDRVEPALRDGKQVLVRRGALRGAVRNALRDALRDALRLPWRNAR